MPDGGAKVTKMLEQAPLPQMVQGLALAIAHAQLELNRAMVQQIEVLANSKEYGIKLPGDEHQYSMLELGFVPSYYHFAEMNITARVAFSSAESSEFSVGAEAKVGYGLFSASVNASYSNKYSFTAEGSSEVRTKIISVPPPTALTDLINRLTRPR